jgi:hypothetical protein
MHPSQVTGSHNDGEASDDHERSGQDEPDARREQTTGDAVTADDHNDIGSREMSGHDDGNVAADDHVSAASEGTESDSHGAEAEGPSELARNVTLGGFAGVNGAVLVAAAFLKKKYPKKGRNRVAARGTSPTPEMGTAVVAAPITLNLAQAPVPVPVVVPITEPIDTAVMSETDGEDVT